LISTDFRSSEQTKVVIPNSRGIYAATTTTEGNRTPADFVRLLFRLLDELGIRYCILHSWDELPENPSSDLDLAIHPDDLQKLPCIFLTLGCNGYRPLQRAGYAINHYRLDFLWFENLVVNSMGINIMCGCVGGNIFVSGEALVAKRHRQKTLWIPTQRRNLPIYWP
jgi:hypothetical protein